MAQGTARSRTQKNASVQLDYLINLEDIKPWPPTQSLRTLRAVLIQWEHGDRSSGMTNQVVPSLGTGSGIGDGRIEFNESFRLPVTLIRDLSVKRKSGNVYHKNFIEFNLYEPRREKALKGQLLGTAVLDLAAHGVVKESVSLSIPVNCKRTFWNTQPLLHLKIQSNHKGRGSTNSSTRESLTRENSLDRNNYDSVSVLSEEYAEEAERASFTTDDDISSHSSLCVTPAAAESNGSSSPQTKENGTAATNGTAGEAKTIKEQVTEPNAKSEGISSRSLSMDLSSDLSWISRKLSSQSLHSSASGEMEKQRSSSNENNDREKEPVYNQKTAVNGASDEKIKPNPEEGIHAISEQPLGHLDHQTHENTASPGHMERPSTEKPHSPQNALVDDKTTGKLQIHTEVSAISEEIEQHYEDIPLSGISQIDIQKRDTMENDSLSNIKENFAESTSSSDINRSKHSRSVRSSGDPNQINASVQSNGCFVAQESIDNKCKDATMALKDSRNLLSDNKVQHLKRRISILEGELREAAATEVSLYSVIAEHGSSMTKVHAPARRLFRYYSHTSKQSSKSRSSAAKSIVSGLILVSKACGNDVPRLTFWLSNSIVLRVIMSKSFEDSKLHGDFEPSIVTIGNQNGKKKSSVLRWDSLARKGTRNAIEDCIGDWENPLTFVAALEKVEAWIFSRIIESLWWQTFTPHMQSGNAEEIRSSMDSESNKFFRTTSSIDQQQGNFSTELWKMAFRDACEKICPVRAGGHDCGCLPVLSRVIMEQLIARLDVAMFNAILRESAEEIPTDPIADPISDPKVLPISSGKASFGAGAQLKTAIGNWSRWLTDLFGIDDNDDDFVEGDEGNLGTFDDDERISQDAPSKSFHLLNALSDLMMLPKDLLLSRTVRKEVCPTFGPPIIARVLNFFVPDEFCPDQIPVVVVDAINSELDDIDLENHEDGFIMNFPCGAAAIAYEPPPAAAVADILGELGGGGDSKAAMTRTRSSVLKKSQTSDDELEELDCPLKSVILGSPSAPASPSWSQEINGSTKGLTQRYQLLRDVWMNCD